MGGESSEGKGLKSRDELIREIEGLRDRISRLSAASLRISAFQTLWIWPEGVDTASFNRVSFEPGPLGQA